MQWLINTIKELIHSQLGFFDRGDPVAADFEAADLVGDNTWRDLDLSAIVPAAAQAVTLRVTMQNTTVLRYIDFRKKSHVGWPNIAYCRLVTASIIHTFDKLVALDSNRFCQYRLNHQDWTALQITVAAWWLR
ncbi:hypothetical protein ES703_94257 [subsurface metagenome]